MAATTTVLFLRLTVFAAGRDMNIQHAFSIDSEVLCAW